MKLINYRLKRQFGFTIIELLISIGIFVVITALFLANFKSAQRSEELKIFAETLAGNIRRAYNLSLSGQSYNGSVPIGGYGIYINSLNSKELIIFTDKDGCEEFNQGEELSDGKYPLPSGIKFSSISPNSPLNIVFKPPKPIGFINAHCSIEQAVCKDGACKEGELVNSGDIATVTLQNEISGKKITVTVNRVSGQVSVE